MEVRFNHSLASIRVLEDMVVFVSVVLDKFAILRHANNDQAPLLSAFKDNHAVWSSSTTLSHASILTIRNHNATQQLQAHSSLRDLLLRLSHESLQVLTPSSLPLTVIVQILAIDLHNPDSGLQTSDPCLEL